eukprot:scaffold3586_cov404-Prasinococcus_capsulatus_cf.AAC.28
MRGPPTPPPARTRDRVGASLTHGSRRPLGRWAPRPGPSTRLVRRRRLGQIRARVRQSGRGPRRSGRGSSRETLPVQGAAQCERHAGLRARFQWDHAWSGGMASARRETGLSA